jgi:malonyl-CoA/methylmalonyl-CoA synthetase
VQDDAGQTLAPGEVGGIQVKGPNVFSGYWQMPEKTQEEFTADGYFKTGDVGTIDADGYVTIVGRSKDLIISGGYNVYPAEIEGYINALPGVAESAVVGVPDADFGKWCGGGDCEARCQVGTPHYFGKSQGHTGKLQSTQAL